MIAWDYCYSIGKGVLGSDFFPDRLLEINFTFGIYSSVGRLVFFILEVNLFVTQNVSINVIHVQ